MAEELESLGVRVRRPMDIHESATQFVMLAWAAAGLSTLNVPNNINDSTYDVGIEMLFDAALCLRFGRDLLVNIATENHLLACESLERHLEGRYTVHRMHRLTRQPHRQRELSRRPGTLLIRSRRFFDYLPAVPQEWDVIEASKPNA